MAFRKNKPGCPCCTCQCPDDGPEYPRFSTIRVEISGLGSSYDYYNETFSGFGTVITHEGTVTGLDAANGTYLIVAELEPGLNFGCIVDGDETYPVLVYEEEFTLYYTETVTSYPNFDCDPTVPFHPTVTVITYEETFKLTVTKEGDHWYKVALYGAGAGAPGGGLLGFLVTGCQVFACENNFDASTDGTLTDSQRLHLQVSEGGPVPCSDGDIYFTPFGYSDESTSTICGRGREFADVDIVGTIAANLE